MRAWTGQSRRFVAARRRDERGAVAPIVAMAIVLLVVVAAFVVDLGVQRVARRDMQALADAVAIDTARVVDGRTTAQVKSGGAGVLSLQSVLDSSVNRNIASVLGTGTPGCAGSGTISSAANSCVRAYLVKYDDATGVYPKSSSGQPIEPAAGDTPNGVVVVASTRVDFKLSVVIGVDNGDASRSALAGNLPSACFKLGSYAAAIKSGSSTLLAPLNSLLGLNLTAVSYEGLANAAVSVADIVATGQVGTADGFLNGTLTVRQLAAATIVALQNQAPPRPQNQVAITALQAIVNSTVSTPAVRVADALNISANDGAALSTGVSVLDLVAGSIRLADGTHALAIPGLSVSAGSLGGVTVNSLTAVERPSLTCGTTNTAPPLGVCATATVRPLPRGCAQNSQVRGEATIPLNLANLPVGSTVFSIAQVAAKLKLDLGNGAGVLSPPNPTCGAGTASSPDTEHVSLTTSLATADLTGDIKLKTPVLDLGLLLGKVIVSVDISFNSTLAPPSSVGSITLKNPPNQTVPVSGGSDVRLASLSSQPTVSLVVTPAGGGLPIISPLVFNALNLLFGVTAAVTTGAINGVVVPVVNSLISSLNSALLGPLATLLGLDVAGADVFMVGRPTCQNPGLRG